MHCTHLILKAREFMNEQQQVLRVITKPQSSNHKDVTQQVILVCKKKNSFCPIKNKCVGAVMSIDPTRVMYLKKKAVQRNHSSIFKRA